MKKMLTVTNDAYLAARTSVVLVVALALGLGFWTAMTPVAKAQPMSATAMIGSKLPSGKTMATATKSEFLSAVCAAVKKWPDAAPQIVRAAVDAKKQWARDIVATAIRCLPGQENCDAIAAIVAAAVATDPEDASGITEMVIRQYPDCRGTIGHDFKGGVPPPPVTEGNFINPPPDVNPPPGSIGGGGGGFNPQENRIQVCRNGVTIFIFPSDLMPGDVIGPCCVTCVQNQ
jgi:hypothetical protein